MAFVYLDRVKQLTTQQGTAAYVLGPVVPGFRSFADEMAVNDETVICARDASGQFEIIKVTLVNATTLSRDTVLSNIFGTTAKIDWLTSDQKELFGVMPSVYLPALNVSNAWLAHQRLQLFRLLFGASDLTEVSGTDTQFKVQVSAALAVYFKADGELLFEWQNDNGAVAGSLTLTIDSSSPAVDDWGYAINWRGKDSGNVVRTFMALDMRVKNASAGAIAALGRLRIARAGALVDAITVDGSTSEIRWKSGFTVIDEA